MFLSFAMIIDELFLDAVVGFFNSRFKYAGVFSLFIPLYSSSHLTKPAQDCRTTCTRLCKYLGQHTTYFNVELPQNMGRRVNIFFYLLQLLLLRSLSSFEKVN